MKEYTVKVFDNRVEWYFEGKLHREGGPAVEWSDGTKEWWKNGEHHREDGPAIEYSCGKKYWYKDGKLHREDGPAAELANGKKYWFLEGKELTKKEFNNLIKAKIAPTCEDKCVEVDGVKYKLVKI